MFFLFRKKRHSVNPLIVLLLGTSALIHLAGAMLGPIYALFVADIGGSLLDASIAGAVFALTAGIVVLLSGMSVDKSKNPQSIVTLGYIIIGVSFILYTFVQSIFALFLVQILMGIGEAIYSPAFDAVYSKNLDKHKEGKEWAAWEAMYYFVTAGGAVLGGIIASVFGFITLFICMSFLCLLSATLLNLLYKRKS